LQLFFLKEKLRSGSPHIIKKPNEMNRPPTKLTSLMDGGDEWGYTHYPSHNFGTGSWPFFQRQNQKASKGAGVSRRKPGCEWAAGRWITLPEATFGFHAIQH